MGAENIWVGCPSIKMGWEGLSGFDDAGAVEREVASGGTSDDVASSCSSGCPLRGEDAGWSDDMLLKEG